MAKNQTSFFSSALTRLKAMFPAYASVGPSPYSMFGSVREPFAGAWQRGMEIESRPNILAFSAVYSCVRLIADDIAKLRIKLMQLEPDGTWSEVNRFSPLAGVLRKPNPYQTRVQFMQMWVVTKLLYGNAYIFKVRDNRNVVVALYPLDPRNVVPMVDDEGGVWYRINQDHLNGINEGLTVPASEIIHDRYAALFHPLVGISPIYACSISSTHGLKIQANSLQFFTNMSRPSGHLTADGKIDDPTAARLKKQFEETFSGSNFGRLLVTGGGLKYEPMTVNPDDAQLIEQLKWTGEDVARAFGIPLYKIGLGPNPTFNNITSLNQDYYAQTLQVLIESIENLLDEGLNLPSTGERIYGTELDLDALLRMDPISRAEKNAKAIGAGYYAPNEARVSENLKPVEGGDTPYMQQQNYSLAALAKRDADDPFAKPAPAPAPTPATGEGDQPAEGAGADGPPPADAQAPEDDAQKTIDGLIILRKEGTELQAKQNELIEQQQRTETSIKEIREDLARIYKETQEQRRNDEQEEARRREQEEARRQQERDAEEARREKAREETLAEIKRALESAQQELARLKEPPTDDDSEVWLELLNEFASANVNEARV